MKHIYQYVCQIMIDHDIHTTIDTMLDEDLMPKWQTGLIKIERKTEQIDKQSDEKWLHFKINGHSMTMKENTILNGLPNRLVQTYEMGDVWNECVSHFHSINNQTQWTMDVTFKFKSDPPAEKKAFENKTYQGMLSFKNFIESYKKSYKD